MRKALLVGLSLLFPMAALAHGGGGRCHGKSHGKGGSQEEAFGGGKPITTQPIHSESVHAASVSSPSIHAPGPTDRAAPSHSEGGSEERPSEGGVAVEAR